MKRIRELAVVAIMTGLSALCLGPCAAAQATEGLGSVSYFYVGGTKVREENVFSAGRNPVSGSFVVDQIGVMKLEPSGGATESPIVLTPGFGLAGHIFLTTADGRPGWAQTFLNAGHTVYIVDRAHTARTGFNVFAFNSVARGVAEPDTQPSFILWLEERIWARWGLGPAPGKEFEDGQFPVNAIDQLLASFAPVISAGMPLRDQAIGNVEGLIELLEQSGPSILLTHSASGLDGFNLAKERPQLLQAIVAVEPVGCGNAEVDSLDGIPVLSVFGDHLDVRPQMIPRFEECVTLAGALSEKGQRGAVLSLPEAGVNGNSHIMMSDRNSDDVARRIVAWLDEL